MMERGVRRKSHAPCEAGEKVAITSKSYLSLSERMEQGGCTYAPMEPPLPPMCYSILPSTGEVIQIDRWQKGYTATKFNDGNRAENEAIKDKFNEKLGVTKAQEQAMLAGSMSRWDSIAAKPKSYDENGKAIKPKDYER